MALVVFAVACDGGGPLGPAGSVRVVITTTGIDRDAAYEVVANGQAHAAAGTPATVTIGDLRPGNHSFSLQGLASNCTATGGSVRTVKVPSGGTAQATFAVSCTALTGAMKIVSTMSGVDIDTNGVTVQVGNDPVRNLRSIDSVVVDGLSAGDRTVTIGGLAPNCTVAPNPRAVRVVTGGLTRDTVRTVFATTCTATTGGVRVVVQTTGLNQDPDGYSLTMDGVPRIADLPTNGERTSTGIVPGSHSFQLDGIAPNCTVNGTNPRVATVIAGATLQLAFTVNCVALLGNARIVAQTTGTELDPDGYAVRIDGSQVLIVPVNGSATATGLSTGSHQFWLEGVAVNCVVAGPNPRSATVLQDVTIDVTFEVSCAPIARIVVSAPTAGPDPDRNGYRIQVTSEGVTVDPSEKTVAANGTVTFEPLPAASYTVALLDLAANCEVSGGRSRTVLATGGATPVTFPVTCTVLERIAFSANFDNNWDIYTSKADGTDMQRLTQDPGFDQEPAWSAIGGIAFQSNRNANTDIYVMSETGGPATRLTTHPAADRSPAWSPDGRRIAFASERDGNSEIYVMDADGGNVLRLTNNTAQDTDPAWSSNGKIAFMRGSCTQFACIGDIYSVNADGQQPTRLTQTGQDGYPDWSADGMSIAFSRVTQCSYYYYTCDRDIMVMASSGADVRALIRDSWDESEPAWSSTGSRLVLSLWTCTFYYYCSNPLGIRIIRPDGSDPIDIHAGAAINPVWRR